MKSLFLLGTLLFAALGACSSASTPVTTGDASTDGPQVCPTNPPLKCIDPSPSYTKDVAPVLHEKCSPCHFPGGISYKIYNLSNYADVVNADTAIVGQVYACNMPPIHGIPTYGIPPNSVPALTTEELATLLDWIECGVPNN